MATPGCAGGRVQALLLPLAVAAPPLRARGVAVILCSLPIGCTLAAAHDDCANKQLDKLAFVVTEVT